MMNGLDFDHTGDEEDILGFNFMHQHEINSLPDTSVLIDTGSTVSVFRNKEALRNITKSATALRAHTNGGFQDSVLQGDLPGFFKVWYNPHCMVNILAWSDVRKKFRITADTSLEPAIWPREWRTHQVQGIQKWFVFRKHQGDTKEVKHQTPQFCKFDY